MENKPSVSKTLMTMLSQAFKICVIWVLLALIPYYTGVLLSIWYPLNQEQIDVSILSLFTIESTIENTIGTTLYRYGVLVDAVIALLIIAFILWYKHTRDYLEGEVTLDETETAQSYSYVPYVLRGCKNNIVTKSQLRIDELKHLYKLTIDTNDYMGAGCLYLYENNKFVKKFWDVWFGKDIILTKEESVNIHILTNYTLSKEE